MKIKRENVKAGDLLLAPEGGIRLVIATQPYTPKETEALLLRENGSMSWSSTLWLEMALYKVLTNATR